MNSAAVGRDADITAGRGSARDPQQILQSDAEDIRGWVEGKLIDKVGQLGKNCIPGRSRNDRVARPISKLWVQRHGYRITVGQSSVANCAGGDGGEITRTPSCRLHPLQRAQPVTFASSLVSGSMLKCRCA